MRSETHDIIRSVDDGTNRGSPIKHEDSDRMKCPFCLEQNQEDALFCSHCGRNLEQTCPVCATSHTPDARFCRKCGTSLSPGFGKPKGGQEGERKLVSVLFADAVGFTALSELLDPEEVAQIMQGCLSILTQEIERYGGTVTQFTGDGIMALFGAPSADEDHAKRACHAGIAIRSAIIPFSNRILKRYGSEFRLRIGINSGMVVVGSVESGGVAEYTALGDTINIASRIESIAPPGTVCCSADTFRLAQDFFQFDPLGSTKVKGKAHPIELYKVVGIGQIETRLGAAMARGLTPFVGRQEEMRDLSLLFKDVEAGKGRVVSIVGEAGVGKSRLLHEFRWSLRNRDSCFLVGECLPFGTSIAYLPLRGLLRAFFGLEEGRDSSEAEQSIRAALRDSDLDPSLLLPPLLDVLSIPWRDEQYETTEPRQKKERIFRSITEIFERESRSKPLIIAVESAMWIDRTSEEFFNYLAEVLSQNPILLIFLYRPGYSHSQVAGTSHTRLNIDQLPAADAPQLITALLDAPPSRELESLLMATSGGNPLFMEELINNLSEKGYISKTKDQYALSIDSADLPIPATIHGIIAARIDNLAEPLKRVLQFAAVLGKHFSHSILHLILSQDRDLDRLLVELQQLDLIYQGDSLPHLGSQIPPQGADYGVISEENAISGKISPSVGSTAGLSEQQGLVLPPEEGSRTPAMEYRFKHDLVQEVAYNSLLVRKRKEMHLAAANAIETFYSDNLEHVIEILAYHFSKTNDNHKAYIYLWQSGAKNTRTSSLWEAFRFYKQALSLNRDTSREEGLDVRLQMASAMISLGFPEDSLEILKQAEAIARSLNDKKSLISVISMIGLYYSVRGDTLRGIKYALDCLAATRETRDADLIAPIVFDLCSNYVARGEYGQVVQIAPTALSLLKETGKQEESFSRGYNIYSAILAFYAFSLGFLGKFEQAEQLFEEGLSVARSLENLYSMGLNEILYGYMFCQKADGKTALIHFERSIGYLERGQIFVLLGLAWNGVGRARYFLGDLQDALTYAEKGLKVHTDAGVTYNLSAHFWFLALLHYELGDVAEAKRKLEESFRLARKNRESYYVALSKMLWGKVALDGGALTASEAQKAISQATRMFVKQGVQPQVAIARLTLAEVSIYMGNHKKARTNLREARALFDDMGMTYWTEKANKLATFAKL
jgi:class 3 adenylate cyclase/tetratricopeptide (TPR) repeat protein